MTGRIDSQSLPARYIEQNKNKAHEPMNDYPSQGRKPLGNNDNSPPLPGGEEAAANRPKLPASPQLVELFADVRDGAAAGFALAQVPRSGRVLWVQDRMAALETGRPFGRGCENFGCTMDRLALVSAGNATNLLWAMEEGLRCSSLTAIIGEIRGDPRALDFTATKRLAMRAERQGVHVFLIRWNGAADLSAARQRWRIGSLPSAPDMRDPRAPGAPRWHAELFRARGMKPGTWTARYDRAAHRLDLAAALRDPALAEEAESRAAATR